MDRSVEDYIDLGRRAVETPRGVALAAHRRDPLSWAELWNQVRTSNEEFAGSGITPRSVAVLALPSGAEFISAFLAITLRAACAPLDLSLTKDEYRFYLSKINAASLVFADDVNPAVVEVGRDNLRAAAQQDFNVLQIGPADRYLSLTPLCHAHGLVASLTQLYCGGGVFCDSAFAAASLFESLQQFRPTWLSAGVPVLRTLLALARENPDAFRRIPLRFIRSTGASPDEELLHEFEKIAGVRLLNGYGLTEVPGVTRNTLGKNLLLRHPAVADSATFPIPHRTLEQEPAAAVVLRAGAEVSPLELRRFAATHLAAYKVPRKIIFLDEIPRATTGKPKRAALSEQFRNLGAAAQSQQPEQPASEIEEKLITIWRRVLNVDRVTVGDDFFDLGGDSLAAAHMLTQAAAAFRLGRSMLPEADFFDHPTISALAGYITGNPNAGRDEPALANNILVLESQGTRLPIFCFSTGEQDAYQFRHVSRWLGPEHPFTVVCPGHPVQQGRMLTLEEIARQSVTSIRALRPVRPYVIGGHCYGGVVAFEACRQLIAEGQTIALLVLFDTPTPGYPKITWKRYPRAAGAMVSDLLHGRKPVTFRDIGAHVRVLTGTAAKRVKTPLPNSAFPAEAWHPALMSAYQPRRLAAPIVHFVGAGVNMSTKILSDPRMGWRDFAGAGFEAHSVPGDHVSIFSESNAPVLASQLEAVLRNLATHAETIQLSAASC